LETIAVNKTQLQTTIAPLIGVLAGFLAGKGVFGLDAATWATVIGSLAGTAAIIWGAISARKTALTNTVGNLPNTTVVTDKATADALPANASVVSNTDVKVVSK
jgi:hypothetical protein